MAPEVTKSESSPEQQVPQKKASVVIVAWNCAPALRRCLQALDSSVQRETFEVIVVDRASRDGSSQLDTEFPKVTMLRLPRNFGTIRARNIGIRTAQTDLIMILSPFVELEAGAMQAVMAFMAARDEAAAAAVELEGGQSDRLFIPDAAELGALCRPESECDFVRALLVRRGFLQGMNYFDEKRFSDSCAELELFWQLRNAGKTVLLVDGAKGRLQPREFSIQLDGRARDLIYSDRVAGAAAWLGKHQGMGSALGFQLKQVLSSLAKPRRGFYALTGTRIDGTQSGFLS